MTDPEDTRPIEASELREALEKDAGHHIPDEAPTRPDLRGPRCPCCHGTARGNPAVICPCCRGTGTVSREVLEAWREMRGPGGEPPPSVA